jgi:RNA polymerase subunit RPABC4/transcription elongation factor Spt4
MPLTQCRHCGKSVSNEAALCPHCGGSSPGSEAPSLVACDDCGQSVSTSARNCPHCGRPRPGIRPFAGTRHRGGTVLTFGILGLACCFGFGIAAWIMGNHDLPEMDEGRMDPSGREMTRAGRICGIVSVGLSLLQVLVFLVAISNT